MGRVRAGPCRVVPSSTRPTRSKEAP
jgi:hypothetical protein